MSGLKDIVKGGWHPEGKQGGKARVNTVAGWVGKGKDTSQTTTASYDHQSTPLSTLKDPASFGPPPKHAKYHGAAAASSSSRQAGDSGGLGSPADGSARQRSQQSQEARARQEEEANRPPPGPYRSDTTGLSTAHLPKPPTFRPGQAASPPAPAASTRPKPNLPPRLPPRQNSNPDEHTPAPPPPYSETPPDNNVSQGVMNQGAVNRLGQAGVAVPGLNIGRNASPPVPPRVPPRQNSSPAPASPATAQPSGPQLSELQSRFSKMSTSSSNDQGPSTGTSWADKRAALNTAGNLRNDPSKVSGSDLRSAASTANNFGERHGEQAAAGWRAASGLNQKYGIADRMNNQGGSASPRLNSPTQGAAPAPAAAAAAAAAGKKAPPPPPPKKKDAAIPGEPPPVPLGSKPKF